MGWGVEEGERRVLGAVRPQKEYEYVHGGLRKLWVLGLNSGQADHPLHVLDDSPNLSELLFPRL